MLISNYENVILNKKLYLKSYIFQYKTKVFNLNIENQSYHFKLLKTVKYIFLKKDILKKNKIWKKKLFVLNLTSIFKFFLIKQNQIKSYIKLFSFFKHFNSYTFKSLYIYFIQKMTYSINLKNTNHKILQYKALNITPYIYNFKRKKCLNLNIHYIKQKEKKEYTNLHILYFLKKKNALNSNIPLFEQKFSSQFFNILNKNMLSNYLKKKKDIIKCKNLNLKYMYSFFYFYSFFLKNN